MFMTKFILGRKLGMTTIYDEEKGALNVTLIECEPNSVSLIRSQEKDGYSAVQIGARKSKVQSASRRTKSKVKQFDKIKEFRIDNTELKTGDNLDITQFEIGDIVKVSGITKAKGFQGVMKRHGFKGSDHSHGHKHDWRAPGSIGSSFPEHVMKGKKMAGRMGGKRASTKNVKVVFIDKDKNLLGVKGAVPGVVGRIVEIMSV
jgi:large subunit ribosomal protein L3